MRQNRWMRIYEVVAQFAIYPLLVLFLVVSVLTCGVVVTLAFRLVDTAGTTPGTSVGRLMPTPRSIEVADEMTTVEGSGGESSLLTGTPPADAETASPQAEYQNQPDVLAQDDIPATRRRRSTVQPSPNIMTRLVAALRTVIYDPTPRPPALKIMPTPMPTSTGTPTATSTTIPSPTFILPPTHTPASAAIASANPAPGAIPIVYPTSGAIPIANPSSGAIPVVYPTPGSLPPSTATLVPSLAISPTATLTPLPEYNFMLAEFYNSPTTNSFLMIYVAVVDPREIPIGGMKIVGTRLDHNLTYESPLSTWHYEGYSAPGEVIKSGNVKFEPPDGIETSKWILHLEDAHGNRQSEDVSFDVDANAAQWYFIKFRRKF